MDPSTSLEEKLATQIKQLEEDARLHSLNHQALIDCATAHLRQQLEASRPDESFATLHCNDIALLGKGSNNNVYQLSFSDGTRWAASLPRMEAFEQTPIAVRGRESEVATMRFVHESGLYPDIPTPAVHAWDSTFDNPVGAPYILMDRVPGIILDNSEAHGKTKEWFVRKFNVYPEEQQLAVVKLLARLKASLSRPVPFDKIGSIVGPNGTAAGPVADYVVGPLLEVDISTDYKNDLDYRPGLTAQVRRYYLRSYFATAYARYAEELFDDTSLARTNIFQDATYYLKFHEATCARLDDWFSIDYWAKETYWRLRAVQGNTQPGDSKASGSTLLVTGPNVYHRSAVERFISDLRVFPEEQMDWQRMFGPEIHGDDDDDY